MKRHIYYLFCALLLIASQANAQTKRVTGTVKDKSGPLPGVIVQEKGMASNGTSTDLNGKFALTLKGNSGVIIFKSIGYKSQEVTVGSNTTLNITLQDDAQSLEEVVVVGYGSQKKVTVTGSMSSVSGEAIRRNPSASLQNALVGQLPGFFSQQTSGQPGADGATFYIRGVSSFAAGASNQPLIVVDDIEFTYEQFARLNPNEVESISILKDASMTAVYGIKGANGVVLVTTRRGKSGKPGFNLRSETSFQQPTKFPEYLNAYESALLHNQAAANDGVAPVFNETALEAFRTGSNPYAYPDVNWKDVLFRDFSMQTRNNLDLSGGTEKTRYFISIGHLYQNGMLNNFGEKTDVNNNYFHKRYNYRSNLDIDVNKDLGLKLDLSGNIGQVNSPNYSHPNGSDKTVFYEYTNYLSLAPYSYPLYNPDGSFGYINSLYPSRYNLNNIVNRLTNGGYRRANENNMNFNTTVNYKLGFITKGLSAKGVAAYTSNYGYNRNITRDAGPSYIWNSNNDTYTSFPANTYRQQRYFLGYDAGSTQRFLTMQGSINYDRTFGSHHISALVLYNQRKDLKRGDTRNNNINFTSTNYIPFKYNGYSTRLIYDFRNKYLFQIAAARNGSDRFISYRSYDWFPAVSAGWNISEEPFFKNNIKIVNRLKIRGSYGSVGSDSGTDGNFAFRQTYTSNGSASFGLTHNNYNGILEGRLANEAVAWEKETKFDAAVEFDMFNSHLTGVVDYFDNERSNILTTRGTVSQVFGQILPWVNMGRVNNKGYEVELKYQNKVGKDFRYSVRGMYSVARNKILFRDEATPKYPWMAQTGMNVNSQLAYQWIGFYENDEDVQKSAKFGSGNKPGDLKYADLNQDGKIDEFDKAYVSTPANVAPVNYSFETSFGYKNFGIRVLFQGATDFVASAIAENVQFLGSNMLPVHQQAWTPALGNSAQYPRLSLQPGSNDARANMSTFWLSPGDYLRLKSAEVNYSIPASLIKKIRLQSASVFATGYNLFTWSKLYKRYSLDPEILSGSANLNYPPQRVINFGLSVTF